MTNRNLAIAVGIAALLVPAALAVVVFPTPMVDTRELYAWGRFFPLTMLKHPPLPAWIIGLTDMVLPANAFSAILVGQVINAVGVVYLYATLRLAEVDRASAAFFAFLFATSFYLLLAPLSYALNNDILQITPWLAVVYHFARAAKEDRLGDWAALGAWAAAAVLVKYAAGLLFVAGAIASIIVPEYRRVWRNPRFYLAVAFGTILLLPHLIALRADASAISYAEAFAVRTPTFAGRFESIAYFVLGALMFLAPGWIVVVIGLATGNCMPAAPAAASAAAALRRFLVTLPIVAVAISVALVLALGTLLNHRYGAPFFGLFTLAAGSLVAVNPATWPVVERRVIATGGIAALAVFLAGSITYGFFTSHNYMQEPTTEAAAIVRADWNRHFSCGPGYIFGDRSSAHGLAIAGDGKPYGVPTTDIGRPSWYDAGRLRDEGAIVVYRSPIPAAEIAQFLPGVAIADEKSFTLPLLRTRVADSLTYHYFFIPPRSCTIAPPG